MTQPVVHLVDDDAAVRGALALLLLGIAIRTGATGLLK